jgi:hypothetical protein
VSRGGGDARSAGGGPDWWEIRPAANRKPATYRCPFCQKFIPSMTPHALIKPNGDSSKRRHAHMECVKREREAGRLPTRDEWLKTQPRRRWQDRLPWVSQKHAAKEPRT